MPGIAGPAVRSVAVVIVIVLAIAACGGSGGNGKSKTSTTSTAPTSTAIRPPSHPEGGGVFTQVDVTYPPAPKALDTEPTVSPAVGGLTTVFTVHVQVRSRLGAHGHARLAYRVLLKGIRPRCAVFTELDAARLGSRAPIHLHPPIELGWCAGTYKGTVLLETNPSCPPPTSASAPPCHLFATRYEVVGHFSFVAR